MLPSGHFPITLFGIEFSEDSRRACAGQAPSLYRFQDYSPTYGNTLAMSFRQRLAKVAPDRETVITVGVFDGVHQGHRHLLDRVIELAGDRALPTVITFSNSPITVLRPLTKVNYLTTPEQRAQLLREAGISLVVGLEFTQDLSQVSRTGFHVDLGGRP